MAWSRPLWTGIALVRPLLGSAKAECEDLCRRGRIQWREDPTNVDPRRARARLRQHAMPVLQELWPDVAKRVTGAPELVTAAKLALDELLRETFGAAETRSWNRNDLRSLPGPIV